MNTRTTAEAERGRVTYSKHFYKYLSIRRMALSYWRASAGDTATVLV